MTTHVPTAAQEATFQRYLESNVPYVEKIEADGDEPWHRNDIEARRELFMRRYQKRHPHGSSPADSIRSQA